MVQMMSTTRAGRPSKEKTPKTQHTQHTKSDGGGSSGASNKHQPTPEQLRLAQMVKSSQKGMEDPELEGKIKQVAECTGRTHDDAYFALHDCDYDLSRAIEKLLENQDQGEWQEKKTKKKKQAAAKADAEPISQNQDTKPDREERNNDRDHNDYNSGGYERSSSAPRGRRNDRAPPRFQRAAAGRGKNDDDRGDSSYRGERGRGRGRGSRGRGGGRRGGSGAPRREYSDNNRDAFSNGPQIDTWTNDTAETKQESSFGTWGDMSEDWHNDEWTGSLKESKVFTPSAQDSSKVFSSNDNDAKMFSVSSIETQVFNSSAIGDSISSGGPSLNDSGNRYQHTASPLHHQPHSLDPMSSQDPLGPPQPLGQDPLGSSLAQKPIGQNALGQSTIGQNTLGQRLDLGMLLGTKPNDSASSVTRQTEELAKQTADFISQFQKQATEQIKSAVGIGNSSQSGSMGLSGPSPDPSVVMSQASGPTAPSLPSSQPTQDQRAPIGPAPGLGQPPSMGQTPGMVQNANQVNSSQQAALQQRAKPQRTKLPPPSKIPQSAVVMPGGMSFGGDLGVKFGTWDQGETPSGFSFTAVPQSTAGVSFSTSSATSSLNSHLPGAAAQSNHISVPQTQQAVPTQQTAPQQSVTVGESQAPTVAASTTLPAASPASVPQSAVTSPPSNAAVSAMLDSMAQQVHHQQQVSQSPRPGSQSMYQPAVPQKQTPATPPKDYSQATKISSPPEPIPFPPSTQTDRKSPYQPSGSLASDSAGSSQQLSYSQSSNSYSSAYSANAYKPTVPSTVSSGTSSQYAPQSNSLSGTGLSDYRNQSSAFKSASQSSYNGQGQNSLYANSTNAPNSFQSSQNVSYQSGGAGYQSQSSYHNRDSQSAPAFQSSGVSQSGSAYQNSVSQSSGPTYQRDSENSQSAYGTGQSAYGSASNSQKISGSKLSDSLGKLTVKDGSTLVGSSDQGQSQFDSTSAGTATGLSANSVVSNANTAVTTSTAASIASGPVSVSAVLGLTTPTANNVSSVTGGNSTTLSSLQISKSTTATVTSATSKAPPNLPPGVPPINYMPVGQHGFPIATAFGLQQPPMYSYEDLLLSHQRLPMHNYYDNLPFQPTPTTMTMSGVDHSKLAPAQGMAYNAAAPDASKLNRVDAQSPTNSQTNQQSQVPQTQSTAHGQTQFINHPHSIPPGYAAPSYYYPMQPGPTGYTYPPMIPLNNLMTQVTNAGASSASNQYPKATFGFGSGTATQDYNKAFMGTSQTQTKGSVSSAPSISSTSDLTAASGYAKTHNQAFDKSGFAAGTPPPFNMAGLAAATAGAQGAGNAAMGAPAYVQYVPGLPTAAQPGAQQMLAHQLHQDTMGSNSRGTQQTSSQGKGLGNKSGYGATAYWGAN